MTEAQPLAITPPPALGPPIIGTDPGSIAGIPQPVFASGSATVPATPVSITGTPILPPPQVGFGNNALASPVAITPAPVPPSVAGYTQPQYATGSGTAPTAASLFPSFTAAGASPPIVLNATQAAGANSPVWIAPPALPLPTTPGITAIVISTAPNIPQLPWVSGPTGTPVNTAPPTISGTATVGSTLTATTGTWTNSPTSYAYQWMGNGLIISGANASTYVLQASDAGTLIRVRVTAINAAGLMSADSVSIGPIVGALTATTWNPSDLSGVTLSGGNLIATGTAAGGVRAAVGQSSGKYYFETTWNTIITNSIGSGLALSSAPLTTQNTANVRVYRVTGDIFLNGADSGTSISGGSPLANGSVVGCAVDLAGQLVWFRLGATGNWNGGATANPATGTGGFNIGAISTGPLYPLMYGGSGDVVTANFGASAFTGAVPSGFLSGFGNTS